MFVVLGVLGSLALGVPSGALSADWPQYHFDAARTGFSAGENILSQSNVAGLSLEWRTFLGSGPVSPPVVSGGRVFVGSFDRNLYALDARTGAVLWTGATGEPIVYSPVVDNDRVYVGSEDSKVYAFPASCSTPCAPLWTTTLSGRIRAALAAKDGVVYVGAHRYTDGDLWALDEATGTVVWEAPFGESPEGVAVADGFVFTGGLLAAFPVSCSNPCSPLWYGWYGGGGQPAVSNGTIFVDSGSVNSFSAYPVGCSQPCLPIWQVMTNGGNRSSVPAIVNGTVFTSDGSGSLLAFGDGCPSSCGLIWETPSRGYLSAPSVANDVLYVGGDGYLLAVNPNTGVTLAGIQTEGRLGSPAIAGGRVFVSAFDNYVGSVAAFSVKGTLDETPPELQVPTRIVVNATASNGSVVSYTVTATDDSDPDPLVACTPPSDSVFPIGDTTVSCTATDDSGNTATATFVVHVKGASEQLADLRDAVEGVGPGTSLIDKVVAAQTAIAGGNDRGACEILGGFINQVEAQSGKHIEAVIADALIGDATRIRAVLGCYLLPSHCVPPLPTLTGWWPGDGNTDDVIGSRSAVLHGDATFGLGLVRQAFVLDGDGDFVDVPHDSALNFGSGAFTVALWVFFNETAGEQILVEKWIQRYDSASEGWTLTKLENNVLLLAMAETSGADWGVATSEPLPIPAGTWNHFAATREKNGDITLFMNGVPVARGSSSLNLNSTSSLKFGHRGHPDDTEGSQDYSGFYLNGRIDEVQIFVRRALSSKEIRAIFEAGSAGMCKKTTAETYDLAVDWSNTANPNSVWTYREGTNALPFVSTWTPLSSPVAQPAWAPSADPGNFLPAWFQASANNPEGLDVLLGDVVVHSTDEGNGPDSGVANVIWTSRIKGLIDISGGVWMARDIDRSNTWTLLRNGVTLTSGDIFSGDPFNRANPFAFANGSGGPAALEGIQISRGDVIELRIEKTSGDGDFVGVNFTIAERAGKRKPR